MLKKYITALLLTQAFIVTNLSAEEVVLIANPEIAKEKLSPREIKKIFLGRIDTTNAGVSISPCYFENERVSEELYNIVNKSSDSFRRYWNKRLFSGAGAPPKTFSTPEQIYQYINNNKGAICLSLKSENLPKEIAIVPK